MTFDPDKPVQTRDGRKARIIGGLEGGPERIAVAITIGGMEFAEARYVNGMYLNGEESDRDLINIPETYWFNAYPPGLGSSWQMTWKTREEADSFSHDNRIACVEFTEGDGL